MVILGGSAGHISLTSNIQLAKPSKSAKAGGNQMASPCKSTCTCTSTRRHVGLMRCFDDVSYIQ